MKTETAWVARATRPFWPATRRAAPLSPRSSAGPVARRDRRVACATLLLTVLTFGLAVSAPAAVFLEPRVQSSTNITSTTNGVFNLATNGTKISGTATQLNLTAGSNIILSGTNATDKVSVGIALKPDITFPTASGSMVLGHWGDRFGLSNATLGVLVWYVDDITTDQETTIAGNVIAQGVYYGTNVHLTAIPGTGDCVGIDANGELYRTNCNAAVSGAISNANVLYVDVGGNNSTAKRGHLDLPYATPYAAKTAAQAGDLIKVFPGVYQNATNLFKNGVNWEGYGATLCRTNTTNDAGIGIFDDRFSGSVTCSVKGFSFRYSTGYETTNALYAPAYGPTNYLGCLVITQAASQVTFEFDRIDYQSVKSSADSAAALWLGGGTNCFISGNLIHDVNLTTNYFIGTDLNLGDPVLLESKAIGVYWTGGEHHLDIKRIVCKFNSFYAGGADGKTGNAWVNGDFFFGQFYVAGTSTQSNWRVWANVKELQTNKTNNNSAGAITFGFGGKLYYTGEKVSESGAGGNPTGIGITQLSSSATCESWFTIQKISASTRWINAASGTMHADIQHFEDLSAVDKGITVEGGHVFLTGLDANVTNATGSVFYHSSGDVQVTGMRLSATNSSTAPVLLATNGAALVSCTLLGKAAGFSIAGSSAVSAVLQGCWGRTDESNNVSYLVGPWTVSSNVR